MGVGVIPKVCLIVDIADFLDFFVTGLICVEFLWYRSFCLLQVIEEIRGDCQEITSGEFEDFSCITERGT